MNKKRVMISTALLFLGIFTIVLGLFWPFVISADAYWTDDQARSLSQSQVELHDLFHAGEQDGHTHADGTFHAHRHEANANDPQIAAALDRYQQQEGELKRAIALRDNGPFFLRIVGSLLTTAGAMVWFFNRNK